MMTNKDIEKTIEEMQFEELERLSKDDDLIVDLEQLITAGTKAKIPITFIYPNTDKKVGAVIRPLNSNEWNNCMRKMVKFQTSFQLEVVKVGLLNMKEEPIPAKLIEQMPQGAINEIYNKIAEASGVHESTEDMIEAGKKLMGF